MRTGVEPNFFLGTPNNTWYFYKFSKILMMKKKKKKGWHVLCAPVCIYFGSTQSPIPAPDYVPGICENWLFGLPQSHEGLATAVNKLVWYQSKEEKLLGFPWHQEPEENLPVRTKWIIALVKIMCNNWR